MSRLARSPAFERRRPRRKDLNVSVMIAQADAGRLPLADGSVHCVVTSPPYWGLRDYHIGPTRWPDGWSGCHGLEPTLELFVAHEALIFREVRRVLRDDGTLWLNLGDSYNAYNGNRGTKSLYAGHDETIGRPDLPAGNGLGEKSLKPKDLCGVPWRVALALQADGWP